MRTFLRIVKSALILAQLPMLAGWVWLYLERRPAPGGEPGALLFEIEKGRSVGAIAQALRSEGIISKKTLFRLRYEFFYARRSIRAGEYQLPRSGSLRDILETLIKGRVYLHPVTIAEGLTTGETIEAFLAAGFGPREEFLDVSSATDDLAGLDPRATDLEGYLFPETYLLPKGTPPREICRKMTEQFRAVFAEPWRRRASEIGLTVRQTVTLASLIEKETSLPEERRLVSAVFHNRLRVGARLDCDPTIIYVLRVKGAYAGRLHARDLKIDSRYNTYLYPGLPPGPICSPGRESLEAALYPADSDYFYFVSKNDGSHHFSRTLREHALAVARYQK